MTHDSDPCFEWSLGLLLEGSNPKIDGIHRFQVGINAWSTCLSVVLWAGRSRHHLLRTWFEGARTVWHTLVQVVSGVRWKMVDLKWKSLLKWMIWGYHHFRKHPYTCKGYPSASFNKAQTFEKKHINTSSLKCYNFINLTQHPQKKTVIYPGLASLKTILVFSSPQSKPTRTCSSNSKQRLFLFSNGKITPPEKKTGDLRFETRLLLLCKFRMGRELYDDVSDGDGRPGQVLARLLVSKIMLPRRRNRWPSMQWPRFFGTKQKNAHDVVTWRLGGFNEGMEKRMRNQKILRWYFYPARWWLRIWLILSN